MLYNHRATMYMCMYIIVMNQLFTKSDARLQAAEALLTFKHVFGDLWGGGGI